MKYTFACTRAPLKDSTKEKAQKKIPKLEG